MTSRLLPALAIVALAGCAQVPVERPAPSPAPPVTTAPKVDATLAEAIARHRKLADDARRAGDLATAAQQLQILTVLAPDEPSYARERVAVRAAID